MLEFKAELQNTS